MSSINETKRNNKFINALKWVKNRVWRKNNSEDRN